MVCELKLPCLSGFEEIEESSLGLNKRDITIKQLSFSLGIPFIILSDSSLSLTKTSTFLDIATFTVRRNIFISASQKTAAAVTVNNCRIHL